MARNGVDSLPDPPDAPQIARRIALRPSQWLLVPLMLVLPGNVGIGNPDTEGVALCNRL